LRQLYSDEPKYNSQIEEYIIPYEEVLKRHYQAPPSYKKAGKGKFAAPRAPQRPTLSPLYLKEEMEFIKPLLDINWPRTHSFQEKWIENLV